MRVRAELHIDKSQVDGLGEGAFEVLRPELMSLAGEWARRFRDIVQIMLSRAGGGKLYRKGGKRASRVGEPPALVTGEYRKSFDVDTQSLKRSVQGRIGSKLWHFGQILEMGNRNIRPRPHILPAFRRWVAQWNESAKS